MVQCYRRHVHVCGYVCVCVWGGVFGITHWAFHRYASIHMRTGDGPFKSKPHLRNQVIATQVTTSRRRRRAAGFQR